MRSKSYNYTQRAARPVTGEDGRKAKVRAHVLNRSVTLMSFSGVRVLYPLVRTLILARILSGFEFGFASALSASYATFELITDVAVHRFVLATPRAEYQQALRGAHGLSVVRGLAAGILAVAAAPVLAYLMSVPTEWMSFAWLGPAIFIRSFEHFELRVAERDYRYSAQLWMNVLSNSLALAIMVGTWFYFHDHVIFITMLFAQNISYVVASHLFATTPYSISLRSSHFFKAARFAYPLVLSGIGLAVVSQGDRLLVGSVLDVPTLGIYSVLILTITVPAGAVTQVFSSLALAGLHNASDDHERRERRLLLYARIMLILGVCTAFGLLALMNILVPLVFGARFAVSSGIVAMLALVSFFSLARAEPTTSVLLINHRTRALAALSLSSVGGLVVAVTLATWYASLYTILVGRLFGEVFGFLATMTMLRPYLGKRGWRSMAAVLWAGLWLLTAIAFELLYPLPLGSVLRFGVLGCLAMLALGGLAIKLRPMIADAYS
jgi:O-antigen/teichoic acid export membrane protein